MANIFKGLFTRQDDMYNEYEVNPNEDYNSYAYAENDVTDDIGYQFNQPKNVRMEDPMHDRLNFNAQAGGSNQQVVIVKPDRMEVAQQVCNHLRENRTVICNFENVDYTDAQRAVDFITGSAYALDGSIHSISGMIFVVTPRSVSLMKPPAEQDNNSVKDILNEAVTNNYSNHSNIHLNRILNPQQ